MRKFPLCRWEVLEFFSSSEIFWHSFVLKLVCKIGASNTLEPPYYKRIGRERRRGFGALAQVIGRTSFPSVTKYIVPAAKRVGADLLEIAELEVADVDSGKK